MPVNRLTVGGRNAPWRQLAWFEPDKNSGRHPIYAGPSSLDARKRLAGSGLAPFRADPQSRTGLHRSEDRHPGGIAAAGNS